jgi:tripartite-type tricarboxylate transporter receptor subunit TctC
MGFATFTKTAGVSMTYVPYAGSAPAVNAVLGQHVTTAFSGYAVVSEQIKGGKLRALATATPKRIEPMPDLATFAEQGFKGVEVDNWFGVIAPAKTPPDKLKELSGWFAAAMAVPEVKAKFAVQGLYPGTLCGDEFGALLRQSYDKYGVAIRETGIKTE